MADEDAGTSCANFDVVDPYHPNVGRSAREVPGLSSGRSPVWDAAPGQPAVQRGPQGRGRLALAVQVLVAKDVLTSRSPTTAQGHLLRHPLVVLLVVALGAASATGIIRPR